MWLHVLVSATFCVSLLIWSLVVYDVVLTPFQGKVKGWEIRSRRKKRKEWGKHEGRECLLSDSSDICQKIKKLKIFHVFMRKTCTYIIYMTPSTYLFEYMINQYSRPNIILNLWICHLLEDTNVLYCTHWLRQFFVTYHTVRTLVMLG